MNNQPFTRKMSSKDYLKYALLALMENKSIYKITIRELCEQAKINRSTFYVNYNSLEDCYKKIMTETAAGLVAAVESENMPHAILNMIYSKSATYRRYQKYFAHVHNHYDEFRLFLGVNSTPFFTELLYDQGIDWYTNQLLASKDHFQDDFPMELMAHYIVNAHMGLLKYYIKTNRKYGVEYMAEQMVEITVAGPYSIIKSYSKEKTAPKK